MKWDFHLQHHGKQKSTQRASSESSIYRQPNYLCMVKAMILNIHIFDIKIFSDWLTNIADFCL